MATSIAVTTTTRQVEKRDWLYEAQHHVQVTGTLDVSTLTLADHAPLGFVPSGLALTLSGGLWTIHDPTVSTGDERVDGVLYDSVPVASLSDPDVGIPVLVHGIVTFAKLPKSTDSPARVSSDVTAENGGFGANLAAAQQNCGNAAALGTSSILVVA